MSDPKPAKMLLHQYAKRAEKDPRTEDDRKHVKSKIPAVGPRKKVFSYGNYGLFSTVLASLLLDMRPDDWFYTFVQK